MTQPTPLTYRDAGVDIDAGNEVVERIKPAIRRTLRPEVLGGGIGGFGGLFDLSGKYKEPVLVSGTDGVGTKLILAKQLDRHDSIGIDLVAMCVNDVLVQGAEPLFFLDYFATGKLDVDTTVDVVGGIAKGCEIAGCALIGGETAEMPDMYPPGEYDLAGFTVGAVEKARLIDGSQRARRRRADRHRFQRPAFQRLFAGPQDPRPRRGHARQRRAGSRGRRSEARRCADGTHPHLRQAGAGTAGETRHPRHGPRHRRRAGREDHPRGAEGIRPGNRYFRVAPAAGVRLAAARRRGGGQRNVAHLQLRHRLRADGCARRRSGDRQPTWIAWAWRTGGSAKW